MPIKIINVRGSAKEYLDSLSGKLVVVSCGNMVKSVPDTGRYGFVVCGDDTFSEYGYMNCASYFCCVLTGFLKAIDRIGEGSEIVLVTSKTLEFNRDVPDERKLFEELYRRISEKKLSAAWIEYDKDNESNKRFISSYITEKVPDFFNDMTDYWGCPAELFDIELFENDDIVQRLDGIVDDILIVSAQYKKTAFSMMRYRGRIFEFRGSAPSSSMFTAILDGMTALAKNLKKTDKPPERRICLVTPYSLGFSGVDSANREKCCALYKEITERGYSASVIHTLGAGMNKVLKSYIDAQTSASEFVRELDGDARIRIYQKQ